MKRLFTKGFIAFAVIGLFLSSIQVFANGTGTINQLVQYLTTKDEGSTLTTRTSSIDFVGAGVTATSTANNVTVNIASSVSATGTPTQVAYFTATSTLASSPAFVYDPAIDVLKLGDGTPTYTVNSSQSMAMTKSLPSFYIPFAGQNTSTSTTASTDITLSNDAGTDTTNYLDIGINSSTNTDPLYTGFSAGSGYMYNQSGDLVLATASAKSIKFLTNGTLTANTRLTIDSTGLATFTDGITQAGRYLNTFNGIASTPAMSLTGTWFTGGTQTTTRPQLVIEPSSAAGATWGTSGTALGINAASGFTGNLIDTYVNSSFRFRVTSTALVQLGTTGSIGVQSQNGTAQIHQGTNTLTSGNGDLLLVAREGFGVGLAVSSAGGTPATVGFAIHNNGNASLGIGTTAPSARFHTRGIDATANMMLADAYGTSVYPSWVGRKARGTSGSPTATQANDIMTLFGARGYGTSLGTAERAFMGMYASENWSATAQGTYIAWQTTPDTTTTTAEVMRLTNAGRLGIGVTSPTAMLHLKAGTSATSTAPLKFTSGTNNTTPEDGAVEYDGSNLSLSVSTTRYTLPKTLTGSATLDFPNTLAQTSSDLTITVTGASDGDKVVLGVPNVSVNANSSFTAWVSASNTVTVRFNNYSALPIDPVSGTFKVSVIKD